MLERRPTASRLTRQHTGAIGVAALFAAFLERIALSRFPGFIIRIQDPALINLNLVDSPTFSGGSTVTVTRIHAPFRGDPMGEDRVFSVKGASRQPGGLRVL